MPAFGALGAASSAGAASAGLPPLSLPCPKLFPGPSRARAMRSRSGSRFGIWAGGGREP
jgi:hypothetical protein